MKHLIASLAATVCLAGPATAQDWTYLYATTLGQQDFYNSSGTRLTDVCVVVQQDRANFHRFGRRDPGDSGDPYFGDRDARARIPGMCRLSQGYDYIRRDVANGVPRYVAVLGRFDGNGRLVALLVTEGAG